MTDAELLVAVLEFRAHEDALRRPARGGGVRGEEILSGSLGGKIVFVVLLALGEGN